MVGAVEIDAALPGSEVLLGDDAHTVLMPSVAAGGGRLLAVRRSRVRYSPGRRLIVRYAAEVEWAGGARRTETLCAMVQTGDLPDEVDAAVTQDGSRIGVWRYPHDPFLPGLAAVATAAGASTVLAGGDLDLPDATVSEMIVKPVVYRPGSRAVLRVTTGQHVRFVKVFRRGRVAHVRAVHDALASLAPVPACIGSDDGLGLLVLDAMPGVSLARRLVDGGAVPDPSEVVALAWGLRDIQLPEADGQRSVPAPVRAHAALLATVVPHERGRIERLAATALDAGAPAEQTVHGDFYDAQILVDDRGAITGLLDVDGAATGSATDDPATFLGHLVGQALVHPQAAARIDSYRRGLQECIAATVDPQRLHAAVTGVLLGLATGPFRRQAHDWPAQTSAELDAVEGWASIPVHR